MRDTMPRVELPSRHPRNHRRLLRSLSSWLWQLVSVLSLVWCSAKQNKNSKSYKYWIYCGSMLSVLLERNIPVSLLENLVWEDRYLEIFVVETVLDGEKKRQSSHLARFLIALDTMPSCQELSSFSYGSEFTQKYPHTFSSSSTVLSRLAISLCQR